MIGRAPHDDRIIQVGWAGAALEPPSGDVHVVALFPGGVLVALIDGLGHGEEAAAAAHTAVPVLTDHASESVLSLIQRCNSALRGTRGAAMSLASVRSADASVTWLGVGNVDGVILRATGTQQDAASISIRGGVVGYHLPPLRADTTHVSPGDTLIMTTDGIRGGFVEGLSIDHPPQETAESILARFASGTDDAHVVVVRYLGDPR